MEEYSKFSYISLSVEKSFAFTNASTLKIGLNDFD